MRAARPRRAAISGCASCCTAAAWRATARPAATPRARTMWTRTWTPWPPGCRPRCAPADAGVPFRAAFVPARCSKGCCSYKGLHGLTQHRETCCTGWSSACRPASARHCWTYNSLLLQTLLSTSLHVMQQATQPVAQPSAAAPGGSAGPSGFRAAGAAHAHSKAAVARPGAPGTGAAGPLRGEKRKADASGAAADEATKRVRAPHLRGYGQLAGSRGGGCLSSGGQQHLLCMDVRSTGVAGRCVLLFSADQWGAVRHVCGVVLCLFDPGWRASVHADKPAACLAGAASAAVRGRMSGGYRFVNSTFTILRASRRARMRTPRTAGA